MEQNTDVSIVVEPGTKSTVIPAGYEALPWSDGSIQLIPAYRGRFRGMTPTFKAETDAEAVNAWLSSKSKESENTRQKYLREAERLMLWAASRGMALSDLASEDFDAYSAFLLDPVPRREWIADRRYPKSDKRWRPFIAPLSRQSQFQSMSVVYSMLSYLNRKGWLSAIALDAPKAPKLIAEKAGDYHALSDNQIKAVRKAARQIPQSIKRLQMNFLAELLLTGGPRTSDIVSASMRDIQTEIFGGKSFVIWRVVGKGKKPRAIPLQQSAIRALKELRQALGLKAMPEREEPPYPIALQLRGLRPFEPKTFKGITRQALYQRIQTLYSMSVTILLEDGFVDEAAALESATTHTLRHTALKSVADRSKGDMRKVMKLAGHTSLATSGRYTESSLAELAEFINDGASG